MSPAHSAVAATAAPAACSAQERSGRWHEQHRLAGWPRLGMTDEGMTERWSGLTARQYRKVISLPGS
jgi:hypothetical protein